MTAVACTTTTPSNKSTFDRQVERIGWALFLIMIGALALLPDDLVPEGTWLVGVGLIMIGMNIARHFARIPISYFTSAVGLVAFAGGLCALAGVSLPIFPILLAAIGVVILYSVIRGH
jgi:hypothetical protein